MADSKSPRPDIVTQKFTINLHKRTHRITFKRKAPRAVREIKKFVQKAMGTKDVRIDAGLNKYVWSKGVRNVPRRVRVKCNRLRQKDEDAKEKLYTIVYYEPVSSFKGLVNEREDAKA